MRSVTGISQLSFYEYVHVRYYCVGLGLGVRPMLGMRLGINRIKYVSEGLYLYPKQYMSSMYVLLHAM